MVDNAVSDFVMLWVAIDPLGTVPIFLSVVGDRPRAELGGIANRAVLTAAGVLIGFLVLGQLLLTWLDISMDAFQIAGGITLFLFALGMLFGHSHRNGEDDGSDPAIFPIAMPAIAGPGAILTIMVLTDNDRYAFLHQARTAVVALVVLALQWLLLRGAGRIQQLMGKSGTSILSRIMGMLLAALSVQVIIQGLRGLIRTWEAT
jgi:multiple antibiotic resistance protein